MSLLDTIRNAPPDKMAWIFGFDPDLNHAGYCSYCFTYSHTGKVTPQAVSMGVILAEKGTKRMARAVSLSQAMVSMPPTLWHPIGNCQNYALIEGQQVYYNPKEPLKTTVSKANDLLMIAYVSGAIVHALHSLERSIDIKLLQPFEWKRNAQKEAMHDAFLSQLQGVPMVLMDGKDWDGIPPNIHTLDACCMCQKGAEKIAKGTWL